jgi:hypothetical protein
MPTILKKKATWPYFAVAMDLASKRAVAVVQTGKATLATDT